MTPARLLAAWIILTISVAASMAAPPPADLYVAPNGNDRNPGTAAAPLATIARARDLLRPRIAAGLSADVLVAIRGGTYRLEQPLVFGPEDSGSDRHSVTYAACPGEKVVLSGGRKISGWRRGRGQLWTAELPAVKAGQWYFRQLFVGGRRAVRARTPNGPQWWKLRPRDNSDANDATITLGVDHPLQAWKNVSDVEVVWLNNNDGSRKRLGRVNEAENTFTLAPPHMWPHGLPFEYNIGFPRALTPAISRMPWRCWTSRASGTWIAGRARSPIGRVREKT